MLTALWITPGLVNAEYTFHLGHAPPYLGISIPDNENLFEIFPAMSTLKKWNGIPGNFGSCKQVTLCATCSKDVAKVFWSNSKSYLSFLHSEWKSLYGIKIAAPQ